MRRRYAKEPPRSRRKAWAKANRDEWKPPACLAYNAIVSIGTCCDCERNRNLWSSRKLKWEDSIAELCRKEGIAQSLYYVWSKEFMEAGKRRLAGDIARAATTDEVKDLRREAGALKECVADLTLENRLLKKRMARPACKRLFDGISACANVSGLGAIHLLFPSRIMAPSVVGGQNGSLLCRTRIGTRDQHIERCCGYL